MAVAHGKHKPLQSTLQSRVMMATVKVQKLVGQGVLVPGGYILTACHCVEWAGTGAMVLGDYYLEQFKDTTGKVAFASVMFADPVADIAVLCAPDDQECWNECELFGAFIERVAAVHLYCQPLNVGDSISAHILTHKGKWVAATVTRYGMPGQLPTGCLAVVAHKRIEGGTSGGPVVDDEGRLIGVVSNSLEQEVSGGYPGTMPFAWLALPRWLSDKILEASMQRQGKP